mgnify:CR=1 FL=1
MHERIWAGRRASRAGVVAELEQVRQALMTQRQGDFQKGVTQHLRAFERAYGKQINRLGPNRRASISSITVRVTQITDVKVLAELDARRILLSDALTSKRFIEAVQHIEAMERLVP